MKMWWLLYTFNADTQSTKTTYSIKMHPYKSLVCFVIESSDRLALQQSYLLPTFAVWDSNPMKAA